jgi:DNA primase
VTAGQLDVHGYYRQVTDIDIGEVARELLAGRITQESVQALFCDCPNHRSQSHRSLHISLDRQCWLCWGCGVGGDVLQLVEFVHDAVVTKGQTGRMPDSHRRARDFLAAKVGLAPLAKLASGSPEHAEGAYQLTLRVREALTALADIYHQHLMANAEVLGWFRTKYGIGDETIARLKIGFAEEGEVSAARTLMEGPGAFTPRELTATSAFRPTAQDGVVPFFDRRIIFPYWSRGQVVFMIGRRTPWTPEVDWERSKYKKLAVRNDRDHEQVAPCIRNDLLYNEDVLLARPERVIITEGVTDCISLMEHGFAVVSPVTTRIRAADWERLLPKLRGVKTVFACQDNEISEAGMQGALKTARILADHGITTRVAVLPLGEKQRSAREKLASLAAGSAEADAMEADAKIDVNEFFAAGHTAADFEALLSSAETPLELAISKLSTDIPDASLSRLLDPILAEVCRVDPIEQERYIRLIQSRCGKARMPVSTLRKQLKMVEIARPRAKSSNGRSRGSGSADSDGGDAPPLRSIQVNNRQLRDIIADAWASIHEINDAKAPDGTERPFLFQNGGALVRIAGAGAHTRIEALGDTAMYGILARSANWHNVTEEAVTAAPPSRDTARDMLVNPDPGLPPLESVVRTPTFGKGATLITAPGYHRADALWLFKDDSLNIPEVPANPSDEQVARARSLLLEDLLVDFPFVRDSDRAHAIAAILLPFLRRMIDGLAPIHLIEAPTQGSGKGLLASLISIVSTGLPTEGRTVPESEDEIRKMITAELVTGRPIILLDNLSEKRTLESAALASVVTLPWWTDRLLGESEMLHLRNNALWLMTGNNPRLSDELSRRCIRVRIDPRIDMPWLRGGFRHPLILEWAQENRGALVHAALTLIQAWITAGQPVHRTRLGSFEKWSGVVGGVLDVAGVPGFLDNLNELYANADSDGQMWREFTAAWWEAFREDPKKVGELTQFCEERDLMLSVRGDGSARSQQTRLGKALGAKRDRVFNGLTVKKISQGEHKHGVRYALMTANGGDEPSRREPDLLDFAEEGNVGGVEGNVAEKRSPSFGPIDPISCEQQGNVGNLGNLFPSSREENSLSHACAPTDESAHESRIGSPENVPNVPHVPQRSAIGTKDGSYVRGTFGADVPQTFPRGSPRRNPGVIDLAILPKADGEPP